MKFHIASDHHGIALKSEIKNKFNSWTWVDHGPSDQEKVNYPDYADKVASQVNRDQNSRGILICGSGQGMAMRANKYPQVRAALCWNESVCKLSREHNDANILCLGAGFVDTEAALKLVEVFASTEFEGGRHGPRVKSLSSDLAKGE